MTGDMTTGNVKKRLSDAEFIERFCDDLQKLEELGFSIKEAKRAVCSRDYVRLWAAYPEWLETENIKLPKGLKWRDARVWKQKASKKSVAEKYEFYPVEDDLYFRIGGFVGQKDGTNPVGRIKDFRQYTAVKVLDALCGREMPGPLIETAVKTLWHDLGLPLDGTPRVKAMDRMLAGNPAAKELNKNNLDIGFRVYRVEDGTKTEEEDMEEQRQEMTSQVIGNLKLLLDATDEQLRDLEAARETLCQAIRLLGGECGEYRSIFDDVEDKVEIDGKSETSGST